VAHGDESYYRNEQSLFVLREIIKVMRALHRMTLIGLPGFGAVSVRVMLQHRASSRSYIENIGPIPQQWNSRYLIIREYNFDGLGRRRVVVVDRNSTYRLPSLGRCVVMVPPNHAR